MAAAAAAAAGAGAATAGGGEAGSGVGSPSLGSPSGWSYRAEGAQNVVWSVGGEDGLQGTAVRVRKGKAKGGKPEYSLCGAWPRILQGDGGGRIRDVQGLHVGVLGCLRRVLEPGHPAFALLAPVWLAGLVGVSELMNPEVGGGAWDDDAEAAVFYAYRDRVLAPLLGAGCVPWSVPVAVGPGVLSAVRERLSAPDVARQRPAKFAEVGPPEVDHGIGIVHLMPDLKAPAPPGSLGDVYGAAEGGAGGEGGPVGGTVHVFEIKPKCGFLPTSPFMDQRTASFKKRHSRYVMQQRLKMEKGSIGRVSGYDPLDLFSGRRDRIARALLALARNPQNNFSRADVDVATGRSAAVSAPNSASGAGGREWARVLEALADALAKAPLLRRLRNAQEALDCIDVEGVWRCFSRLHHLADVKLGDCPPLDGLGREAAACLDAADPAVARCLMCMFLTSAVLKDVSVVVRLRKLEPGAQESASASPAATVVAVDGEGGRYEAVLAVLDLDLKPAERIPRYLEHDRRVLAAFAVAETPEDGAPILFPAEHQVAGHMGVGHGGLRARDDPKDGFYYKPIMGDDRGERELAFYEALAELGAQRPPFFATYHGRREVYDGGSGSLVPCMILQDVAAGYEAPCIIDVKLGSRTWYKGCSSKSRAKYMRADMSGTSATVGFKVCGMQVCRAPESGDGAATRSLFEKGVVAASMSREEAAAALGVFCAGAPSPHDVLGGPEGAIEQIYAAAEWVRRDARFTLFSSSALIVYDGTGRGRPVRPRLFLVDFGHARPLDPTHDVGGWYRDAGGDSNEVCVRGLLALAEVLEELLRDTDSRQGHAPSQVTPSIF